MKILLKTEEASMFILALLFFYTLNIPGWLFWIFLLSPDVSMLGYLINPTVGAFIYNLFHHKAVAIGIFILGYVMPSVTFQFIGIILFAHSSMDRLFGYGLKYSDSFQHTHLGMIGKNKVE